jgi:DNA-binding transcriptional MerR regulator
LDKAPDAFRTISEVADDLKVPQHVLRFWETGFAQIKPMKRAGGRRYYRPDDVDLLRGIHHLLYGEGYTIRGVQRILKDQGVKFVEAVWQAGAEQPPHGPRDEDFEHDLDEDDGGRGEAGHLSPRPQAIEPIPAGLRADLSREELRKLQAAMFELNECRRLLDTAIDRNPA